MMAGMLHLLFWSDDLERRVSVSSVMIGDLASAFSLGYRLGRLGRGWVNVFQTIFGAHLGS